MKRTVTIFASFLVFLFLCSLRTEAVEVNIRNEENSKAKVALAYLQEGSFIVEGWFNITPEQVETIQLENVGENDVYILVQFEDTSLQQHIESEWGVECPFSDTDFRYSMRAVGGKPQIEDPNASKAIFQNIGKFYKIDTNKLWFNLSTAAG